MAITSDNQWIDVLKKVGKYSPHALINLHIYNPRIQDDFQVPQSEELIKRILDKYDIEVEGGYDHMTHFTGLIIP